MDPSAIARIHDLQAIATFVTVLLLAIGLWLKYAPVGECNECDHCRRERLREASSKAYARCPTCFRRHPPSERCP